MTLSRDPKQLYIYESLAEGLLAEDLLAEGILGWGSLAKMDEIIEKH